jgi:TctA family transporter
MDNIFVISGLICFIFLIIKIIEMKYIEKEYKPFKYLLRDTLVVYFSSIISFFILQQLKPVVENNNNPIAFTDNPPF